VANPVREIGEDKLRAAVKAAVQAVEGFVVFACIAIGLVQMASFRYSAPLDLSGFHYLRTRSSCITSKGTTMCFLRRNLFRFVALYPDLTISRIILKKSDLSALQQVA